MSERGDEVVSFYLGLIPDRGRFLEEIQDRSDDALEKTHDYIQWLFPLTERSSFNSRAPILQAEAISKFHSQPELRADL